MLIKDLVNPCTQKLSVGYGKHEFDGEVMLGKGTAILYEIYGGSLSRFRFNSLLDTVRSTYFPRKKTYLLNIARGFSKRDVERIHSFAEKIVTKKVKPCFMDYEVLIDLHKFSLNIAADAAERDLKIMKRLFLSRLFDSATIINRKFFQSALSFAQERYFFELQERVGLFEPSRITAERASFEHRLTETEKLLLKALDEIRQLRRELDRAR